MPIPRHVEGVRAKGWVRRAKFHKSESERDFYPFRGRKWNIPTENEYLRSFLVKSKFHLLNAVINWVVYLTDR